MTRALITTAALSAMTIGVFGCNNKSASIPTNSSVADVSAPAPTPAYQPAPQPVQPIAYDSTPTASASALGNGNYTVKRGDTLYGIARSRYGDGKQWTKITQANPGLKPETLKVGQTFTLP